MTVINITSSEPPKTAPAEIPATPSPVEVPQQQTQGNPNPPQPSDKPGEQQK